MKKILAQQIKKKIFQPFWKYLFHLSKAGMNYWPPSPVLASGEVSAMKYANKKLASAETKIIFDIGANLGQFALAAEKVFSDPKEIYCFEPSLKTFDLLNASLTKHIATGNFKSIRLGLSDSERNDTLFSSGTGSSVASLHSVPQAGFKEEFTEIIHLTTLDDFCKKNEIRKIDYLKLDIEGHEYFALKGAGEMLKQKRIRFIQFEFGQGSMAARIFFRDIIDLLSPDYRLYRLATDGLIPLGNYSTDLEIFDAANYLAELI